MGTMNINYETAIEIFMTHSTHSLFQRGMSEGFGIYIPSILSSSSTIEEMILECLGCAAGNNMVILAIIGQYSVLVDGTEDSKALVASMINHPDTKVYIGDDGEFSIGVLRAELQ